MMRPADILAVILVTAIWGFNFVVVEWGLEGMPPFLLAGIRFALVVFPAIFFLPRPDTSWQNIVLFGIFFGLIQFGLLFFAMAVGISAGLASVVIQSQAFFTAGLSFVLFAERISGRRMAGILLAFVGIGIIGSLQDTSTNPIAVMIVLIAGLSWAAANLVNKRVATPNMVSFVVWASLVPPLPLLAVSLWLDGGAVITANLGSVSVKTIACLLFIAYASTLLAYGIWTRLVVRYTPGLVAPFALLVPVFGMLSSWLFQGEYFGPLKLGAVSLVMLGLALTVLPARPRAPRN